MTTDPSTLAERATDALEAHSFASEERHLSEEPQLDNVFVVNTNRDDEPVLIPWIDISFTTDDDPDKAAAYRIAAEVVKALHSVFRDVHVRQYDIVFQVSDPTWLDWSGEQRLIAVRPRQADRLTSEPNFDVRSFRNRLEELDDGDDEIPPVAWGEPADKWEYRDNDWDAMFGTGGMFGV